MAQKDKFLANIKLGMKNYKKIILCSAISLLREKTKEKKASNRKQNESK